MRRSYLRGHPIIYSEPNAEWTYEDTGESTAKTWKKRPCGYCGLPATEDGHDGCLGELPGVMNACCGHGRDGEAYIQYSAQVVVRGEEALKIMANQGAEEADRQDGEILFKAVLIALLALALVVIYLKN